MEDFEDYIIKKPSIITEECEVMLREAASWTKENYNYPTQAEKMVKRFYKIVQVLETFPEIGTLCQNGMRKFPLGKFPYSIYYREKENEIEILGIWHTSRGTAFEENSHQSS
jgi:plasmid stabilization system protein ParE